MSRWTLYVSCVVVTACASMGVRGKINVDTAPIHYATMGEGEGAPIVVFDAGAGDDMTTWRKIVSTVAEQTQTFVFDRPGYGSHFGIDNYFDTDADGKRTSDELATHLRTALERTGQHPPYILVGHSLGGLNMLAFAKLFPAEVSGVVLVDSRPPAFTAACREAGVKGFVVPGWLTYLMPQHTRYEVRGLEASEQFAADPQAYGSIPITVLAANRRDHILLAESSQQFWVAKQREFASSLLNARFIEVESTHYVHHQQPELVIEEILRMVRLAPRIGR